MRWTLRTHSVLDVLTAILAGCTLAAIAVVGGGSIPVTPGEFCPPIC